VCTNCLENDDARIRFQEIKSYKVIQERVFDLVKLRGNLEFEGMIGARGWELLNSMVHDKTNNTMTMEFYLNARVSSVKYQSIVRGKVIDYSPKAINRLLAWASFVIKTLEITSCSFEISLKRVSTIAVILARVPINVGQLIANNIFEIATKNFKSAGHNSVI